MYIEKAPIGFKTDFTFTVDFDSRNLTFRTKWCVAPMRRYAPLLAHTLLMALSPKGTDLADGGFSLFFRNNALSSPKPQTYIEKAPRES